MTLRVAWYRIGKASSGDVTSGLGAVKCGTVMVWCRDVAWCCVMALYGAVA